MQTIQKFPAWFSKQKLSGKIAISIAGFFLLCCLCGAIGSLTSPSKSPSQIKSTATPKVEAAALLPPTNTATLFPTDTPSPTQTPIPSATPDPNLFLPGTYMVGADIQPGIYKGFAGEGILDSCYWERLKDLTGTFDSILANDNSVGQFYVEIKSDDYAIKTSCELLRLDPIPQHTGEYPTKLSAGTYLVGYDIKPGTYKGQGGADITSSCYWIRLQNVSGDFGAILANDNATGQFYVQVLPSDFALQTACDLEWVGE